jgi:hypothetical protein
VCKPKSLGGLGVRDVRTVNISLLAKWRWRLLSNDDSIWKGVIRSKYGGDAIGRVELGGECVPWFSSLWWKDITSIGSNLDTNWFSHGVEKNIGNGLTTSFWRDRWVGDTTLEERFPRLYSISTQKEDTVATVRGEPNSLTWNFRWRLLHNKVLGFSWMLVHNKIQTKDNLFRRQIINSGADQICAACGGEVETPIHLFLYCEFALQVWEKLHSWLGLGYMLPQNLVSLFHFFAVYRGQKTRRKGLMMVWNAAVWALWRRRNKLIFENETISVLDLVEEIKVSSWHWWIARTNSAPCLLYEWSREPLICMV